MPHTRRKKPPSHQNKRLTVTDESGWTHVTTTGNARRIGRKSSANPSPSSNLKPDHKEKSDGGVQDSELEIEPLEPLLPAEAPPKTTLTALQRQLGLYRERWEGSATWGCVTEGLRRGLPLLSVSERSLEKQLSELALRIETEPDHEHNQKDEGNIKEEGKVSDPEVSIVCIGLGSPSGFLRGGWVDRRAVSMYQLAALVSVIEWIEKNTPSHKPKAYAQDPVFNTHDTSLLESNNIAVLTHPSAFDRITHKTILFVPGAERRHLEILLAHEPAIVIGGPLEDIETDVVKRWLNRCDSVKLDEFDELEAAFWGMSVYYPRASETVPSDAEPGDG